MFEEAVDDAWELTLIRRVRHHVDHGKLSFGRGGGAIHARAVAGAEHFSAKSQPGEPAKYLVW